MYTVCTLYMYVYTHMYVVHSYKVYIYVCVHLCSVYTVQSVHICVHLCKVYTQYKAYIYVYTSVKCIHSTKCKYMCTPLYTRCVHTYMCTSLYTL